MFVVLLQARPLLSLLYDQYVYIVALFCGSKYKNEKSPAFGSHHEKIFAIPLFYDANQDFVAHWAL